MYLTFQISPTMHEKLYLNYTKDRLNSAYLSESGNGP